MAGSIELFGLCANKNKAEDCLQGLNALARMLGQFPALLQKIVRHFSASYNKKIKIFVEPPVTIMAERRTCPGGLLPIRLKAASKQLTN